MGAKKGRKSTWGTPQSDSWLELRAQPAFQVLERLVSTGLYKLDISEMEPLIDAAPALASLGDATPSAVRNEILAAVRRVGAERRVAALEALLHATEESEALNVAAVHQLARVELGEADHLKKSAERRIKRDPTRLDLVDELKLAVPDDSSNFRRAPSRGRPPGELFALLRDLYRELVPRTRERGGTVVAPNAPEVPPKGATIPGIPDAGAGSEPSVSALWRGKSPNKEDIAAIGRVARRHYGTELDLTQLARAVLTPQDAVENLTIDITLSDDGPEWFRFNVIRTFQARFTHFTAGVVLGDRTRASVMRLIPELKELIWLPPETTDIDAAVEELIEDGLLEVRDDDGSETYRPARFEHLGVDDELNARLSLDEDLDPAAYRLLALSLPGEPELVGYRSTLHMRLARSRKRCGWFADGAVYLNDVRIDLSQFSDTASNPNANVYFFLPGTNSYSDGAELGQKVFERAVNAWIFRHHGFAIHW